MILRKLLILFIIVALSGCSVPSKAVKVYFFDEDSKIISVERELPTIENPVLIAIDQLMRGPSDQESSRGIFSKIPAGTRVRKVEVEGHTAIIDFNSTLASISGGNDEVNDVLAQIIYTATSVRGIKQAIIKLQGRDQFTLGREEYVIDHPLERSDVKI